MSKHEVSENYQEFADAQGSISVNDIIEIVNLCDIFKRKITYNELDQFSDIIWKFETMERNLRTSKACPHCRNRLYKSDLPQYAYSCPICDENFFEFEAVNYDGSVEIVETCPHCESENEFFHNIVQDGYVAKCQNCGKKLMLCDACHHSEDNTEMKCDWEGDYGDDDVSVCFRDDSPIEISTYGTYEEDTDYQHVLFFTVPRNWLNEILKGYNPPVFFHDFLNTYIYDETLPIYEKAKAEKKIISEKEE